MARASAFQAGDLPCNDPENKGLEEPSHQHQQYPQQRADDSPQIDAELAKVIDAWPKLAEPIKAAVLAMVNASQAQEDDCFDK